MSAEGKFSKFTKAFGHLNLERRKYFCLGWSSKIIQLKTLPAIKILINQILSLIADVVTLFNPFLSGYDWMSKPVSTWFIVSVRHACVTLAQWYTSPEGAIPHGSGLWLSRWHQDEGSSWEIWDPRAPTRSDLKTKSAQEFIWHSSLIVYYIMYITIYFLLFLQMGHKHVRTSGFLHYWNKTQPIDGCYLIFRFWTWMFSLQDSPVTSVSMGISSIMHFSSCSPSWKYMAAANIR